MSRLIVQNGHVVSPDDVVKADLLIEDEKVVGIVAPGSVVWENARSIDADGCYVMPGLVDPHTHIQLDTGIYQTVDDWEIGTRTAAFGGVTTVVDFATQFPGMSFPQALEARLEQCQPAYIDYSHHMMITDPPASQDDYRRALEELRDLGVPSIKLYTIYRPNYYMDDADLLRTFQAMPKDMLALVHCENDAIVTAATQNLVKAGHVDWAYHGQGRPWQAEYEAVQRVIGLAMMAEAAVYIVHCTLPRTLQFIATVRQAASRPDHIFFETCPQYFTLDDSYYACPNAEHFILQPPLRSPEDRQTMQQAHHLVDVISTDHCDYSLAQKQEFRDFTKTPGGLPGLETSLQFTFTHTDLPFDQRAQYVVKKMSARPAQIFGLYPQKGALFPGSDADVVIYDPRPAITISAANLHTIGGYTPYEGMSVQGAVRTTISRGTILVESGQLHADKGRGRFLRAAPLL